MNRSWIKRKPKKNIFNSKVQFGSFIIQNGFNYVPVALWSDIVHFCDKRMDILCLCNRGSIQWNDLPNRIHDNCRHNTRNRWSWALVHCCDLPQQNIVIDRWAPNHVCYPDLHGVGNRSTNVFYEKFFFLQKESSISPNVRKYKSNINWMKREKNKWNDFEQNNSNMKMVPNFHGPTSNVDLNWP